MNEEMTIDKLRAGMRVLLRSGRIGLLVPYNGTFFTERGFSILYECSEHYDVLNNQNYYKNLIAKEPKACLHADCTNLDIMKVYNPPAHSGCFRYYFKVEPEDLIWERTEVREMTIEEIEKIVGFKVKIISSENKGE